MSFSFISTEALQINRTFRARRAEAVQVACAASRTCRFISSPSGFSARLSHETTDTPPINHTLRASVRGAPGRVRCRVSPARARECRGAMAGEIANTPVTCKATYRRTTIDNHGVTPIIPDRSRQNCGRLLPQREARRRWRGVPCTGLRPGYYEAPFSRRTWLRGCCAPAGQAEPTI